MYLGTHKIVCGSKYKGKKELHRPSEQKEDANGKNEKKNKRKATQKKSKTVEQNVKRKLDHENSNFYQRKYSVNARFFVFFFSLS